MPLARRDTCDGRTANAVAQVFQCALNPRVAPGRILCRHPNHQPSKVSLQAKTTWMSTPVGPFAHDQLTVPAENRVGRHDRRHLGEQASSKSVSQFGEPSPLVVIKTEALSTQSRLENSIFLLQKRD